MEANTNYFVIVQTTIRGKRGTSNVVEFQPVYFNEEYRLSYYGRAGNLRRTVGRRIASVQWLHETTTLQFEHLPASLPSRYELPSLLAVGSDYKVDLADTRKHSFLFRSGPLFIIHTVQVTANLPDNALPANHDNARAEPGPDDDLVVLEILGIGNDPDDGSTDDSTDDSSDDDSSETSEIDVIRYDPCHLPVTEEVVTRISESRPKCIYIQNADFANRRDIPLLKPLMGKIPTFSTSLHFENSRVTAATYHPLLVNTNNASALQEVTVAYSPMDEQGYQAFSAFTGRPTTVQKLAFNEANINAQRFLELLQQIQLRGGMKEFSVHDHDLVLGELLDVNGTLRDPFLKVLESVNIECLEIGFLIGDGDLEELVTACHFNSNIKKLSLKPNVAAADLANDPRLANARADFQLLIHGKIVTHPPPP